MSGIIKQNEYITVSKVMTVHKEINFDAVLNATNEYLKGNEIKGRRFQATHVQADSPSDCIQVLLKRTDSEYCIDEDFESDESWKKFCENMAEKLEVRLFKVPYWYYPK